MKGVEARPNSIRIVFRYQEKQRKETLYLDGAPLAPTPANLRYAARLASDVERQVGSGTFDYAATFPESKHAPKTTKLTGDELFLDLIERWFALLELKASTKSQYRRQKDLFWKVHLENKPIKRFVHSDIKTALQKGTWKSNKSRNNQLSIIRSVFELAVLDKQIPENPCAGLEYGQVQKKKPDPFSQAEVRAILAGLGERYEQPILNYVQFQFYAGLRTSEGIALQWANVDFNRREIMVDSALVYEEEQDSTKTMQTRKVKLTSEAMSALVRQKEFTFAAGGKVFNDPYYDAPWLYQRITNSHFWAATLKRLGIRHRRAYNTRHTYATLGLMAGVNPAYMARQMGHSLEMFFKVYVDWLDGDDDDREMAKLERAILANIPAKNS